MKKSFFIVLICICLLLACCNSSTQDAGNIDDAQLSTQETEPVEVKDYPDLIDTTEGKLLTPLLPDEVFTSSAEENGLDGTLYQVYGTVTEYIYDENSEIEAFRVHTHKGDIVIGDLCQSLISDGTYDELGTIDAEAIRYLLPIPPKDEFLRIFAEYQGMSNEYGCPYFIYGSTDYLTDALLASLIPSEETVCEETVGVDTAPTDAPATTGELNALQSALSYLDFSSFSYGGLIDQLEYEGFTNAEATYAADHCGADWNEQALNSAKNYLDFSAFSHDGLIDQLEYEEFTTEQATYGADNCGADWYEQAVKCAASYLDYTAFSRNDLIDQLEYEGFTHDQAVYGVEQNGL